MECKIVKISEILEFQQEHNNEKIKTISDYIYRYTIQLEEEEKELTYNGKISNLYENIKYLCRDYPDFHNWYFNKVVPGLMKGTREILLCFVLTNIKNKKLKLVGLAILKNTEIEKKICTFRIEKKYRGFGLAKKLFEKCFEVLGTRKPLITISEKRKKFFEKYIEEFQFECTQEKKGFYQENSIEYVYNGRLD